MTALETGRGLLELTRPVNSLAAGVLTAIGAYVAGNAAAYPLAISAAVLATVFAVGAGNAINDYFDREIDRINKPGAPIPRGAVSPRAALVFSGLLFAVAIGCALVLPPIAIAIAVVNLFALVVYTEWFKGLPGVGNAVVAGLVGSTFLFGAAAVRNPEPAVVLFLLAALSTFSREIIKDVEDLEGDRREGLQTLPIAVGERRSLRIAAVLLLAAVVASPAPYLLEYFGATYLVLVLPADAIMVYSVRASFADPTVGQARLKYGTFLATAAFVAGRVATTVEFLP